ncbi:J domain-containing protein [Pseudomonas sp. CMR5c]|uniref:J domain-containing protein n=1 Tax=Pseudomonas sp. CMR5c TaxID=658630 RepID=UPI0009F9FADA|nr:J domain-containing protein [Pseudomonas sp. CMR5c]AZC18565.1 Chaperone protein DnaJ [Pseudomonas sp. CMR5c]
MQSNKTDPDGFYAVLGVSPVATDDQIKAAYRRRAMDMHPDRNPGKDTTKQFQLLNEAYAVLSNPKSRAEYDRAEFENTTNEPTAPDIPNPITCSICAKVTAQPRFVVLRSVKSFIVVTLRKPIAGVYCSDCAQKQSLKASATTWLLGWWGVPWGPIYSLQALVTNMFGGAHPPLENARMLGYQSYYFYAIGRPDLAQSLAQSAKNFANKIPNESTPGGVSVKEKEDLTSNLEGFIQELGGHIEHKQLKSSWGLIHKRFFIHLGAIAVAGLGIAVAVINSPGSHYTPPRGPMPYSAQPISEQLPAVPSGNTAQVSLGAVPPKTVAKQAYVRSKTAPNGKPWPKIASYLAGEPQTHTKGHSEITIDNGGNNSDVFLKLVALQGTVARPARQVFIPAHSQFTIKNLAPGRYDVRYRDLNFGGLSRSEAMQLTEKTTHRGTEYAVITLTLYKVANGNAATFTLSEDEF